MSTTIHMGRAVVDVEVRKDEDGLIRIGQGEQFVRLTPEGARSLYFIMFGMTDRPLKPYELTGKFCSECGEPQFGSPSGITCHNGHGGADSV